MGYFTRLCQHGEKGNGMTVLCNVGRDSSALTALCYIHGEKNGRVDLQELEEEIRREIDEELSKHFFKKVWQNLESFLPSILKLKLISLIY